MHTHPILRILSFENINLESITFKKVDTIVNQDNSYPCKEECLNFIHKQKYKYANHMQTMLMNIKEVDVESEYLIMPKW